jgi:lysophospholipase L1-like esterase
MTLPEHPAVPELGPLPSGLLLKFGSRLLRGVAEVQAHIAPYAQQWHHRNQQELEKTGPTWFVLGDSMSQSVGASAYDNGWVDQLRARMEAQGQHYRIINLSMTGARIEHVTTMQIPAMKAIDDHPDLVTVLVGSNDIVSPRYRKKALENYRRLLEELPQTNVVVSPLGDFGRAKEINSLLRSYFDKGKIRLTDNDIRDWRGKLAQDHFHPNDRGYAEITRTFGNVILKK